MSFLIHLLWQILFTPQLQFQTQLQLENQVFRVDIKIDPVGPLRNNIMHSYNADC